MSGDDQGPIRRAIEVEYWVIDTEGRLVEPGGLVGAAAGVEPEFVEPVLEIKTPPCETTEELCNELFDRIATVLRAADDLNKRLVPLATTVNTDQVRERPSQRTMIQNRVVGADFEYVRHCAGTHVHIEQQAGREIDQLNTLIALDPALALVNSSPYYRGERIASGARSKLYRWTAYDNLPHQGRLWPYAESIAEWNRRLDRRYEEFVTAAVTAGVDRQVVESCFDPESAVWTPVQLRKTFGTIEWRSPDTALPSQILQLADQLVATIAHLTDAPVRIEGNRGRITDEAIVLPEFEVVLELVTAAIEDGVTSDAVRSYLDRMGFDVGSYEPMSQEIDGREPVTPAAARQLRLDYADRLEQDVFDET